MSVESRLFRMIDEQRSSQGFLTLSEVLKLTDDQGNTILDPFSVLISVYAKIGNNNIFYPNVIVQADDKGTLEIGNSNIFYPNTFVLAEKGKLVIANHNQFGDGGCSIKANMPDAEITIGSNGRYINGAQIIGKTNLGSGSQIIGPITVQNCNLEQGGDYRSSKVELRAGLLKGSGLARGLNVAQGMVINGSGNFKQEDLEEQAKYHPKK